MCIVWTVHDYTFEPQIMHIQTYMRGTCMVDTQVHACTIFEPCMVMWEPCMADTWYMHVACVVIGEPCMVDVKVHACTICEPCMVWTWHMHGNVRTMHGWHTWYMCDACKTCMLYSRWKCKVVSLSGMDPT